MCNTGPCLKTNMYVCNNSLQNLVFFLQIYDKYGKELCIVVTNLNMMNTEYFHTKTSPDVPVRVAVRMSMAIPGRSNYVCI